MIINTYQMIITNESTFGQTMQALYNVQFYTRKFRIVYHRW